MRVPAACVVGEVDGGLRYVIDSWNAERILFASEAIGDGYWFIDRAVDYATKRAVFRQVAWTPTAATASSTSTTSSASCQRVTPSTPGEGSAGLGLGHHGLAVVANVQVLVQAVFVAGVWRSRDDLCMDAVVTTLLLVSAIAAVTPLLADWLGRFVAVPLVMFEILLGLLVGPSVLDRRPR